jgi:hypothetical protein
MYSLDKRVEQMYLELIAQVKNRPARQPKNTIIKSTDYIDEKIERYKDALETALRNSPCSGCRRLTLASLTGLAIFEAMSSEGKSRADITDVEIEKIKKDVEKKYASF